LTLTEWELACISGQLSQTLEEEEKEKLNNKFIEIAKQLNKNKKIIEELGR
jgi:hemerythrin-like domain-containing protein